MDQLVFEGANSKVYYREHSEWDTPVAVKVLNYEFPTPDDVEQFYTEYELLHDWQSRANGIRRALKRGKEKNRHVLFLEWVKGKPLAELLRGKPLKVEDFLHLAVSMADALHEVHHNGLVHKDVCPANFIIDEGGRAARLIDFGLATGLELKQTYVGNPERIKGTLHYLSPEQTGRTHRVIDARTDFYALGVTLYEMLTGQGPEADDAAARATFDAHWRGILEAAIGAAP